MEHTYARSRTLLVALGSILITVAAAATAAADTINLAWDPNRESTLQGYMVHVGTQSGTYTQHIDVGLNTSYGWPSAVAGQRYCFAVSAYVAGHLEGPKSNEVCGFSNAAPVLANPGSRSSVVGQPTSLQLQGSDPDGQTVSYTANGMPPGLSVMVGTGFISGTPTSAGTYSVTATVSDGVLQASQTFTWTITAAAGDSTSPLVTITGPTSAATFTTTSSTLSLSGTASDNVGVTQVTWVNNRGGSGTATGTTSWSIGGIALAAADNVITITARDAAGNTSTDAITVTSNGGTSGGGQTAPTVTIRTPTINPTYATTTAAFVFGGTADDEVGLSNVTWMNDRGGSGTASGTYSWNASLTLQTGANVITVTARDTSGKTTSDVLTVTYSGGTTGGNPGGSVDPTAPTITIRTPTINPTYSTSNPTFAFAGTADDEAGLSTVTWTNDRGGSGTASGTYSWNGSLTLKTGVNVITVTARDTSGKTTSDVLTVTYTGASTNTAPTLASVPNQVTGVGQPASVQLVGSDANSDPLTYSSAGLPAGLTLSPMTGLISGSPTTVGTFTVTATVSDGVLTASRTFTWTVTSTSTSAPTVTITTPVASAVVGGRVAIIASVSASVAGVQFLLDGANLGSEVPGPGTSFTLNWDSNGTSNGTHVLAARARESSGRTTLSPDVKVTVSNSGSLSGLVAAYSFDAGSGSTVADSSGQGNNGVSDKSAAWDAGKFGSAMRFNGSSTIVTVPDSASLDLTTAMTLEAWVKPAVAQSGWRTVMHKNVDRFYLFVSSNGDTPATGGTFGSGNQNTVAPSALPVNVWSHLAATFDGKTVKLYINGELVASQPQGTPLTTSTGTFQIGGSSYGEFFNGWLDEIRIYNRALSAAEIQSTMNAPLQ